MIKKHTISVILLIILIFGFLSCNSSSTGGKSNSITSIKFTKTEYDFGTIKMNSEAFTEFEFSNTGEKSLIITQVTTNCGCAEPEWPKKPIKSGKNGIIKIKYDTKYPGRFMKTISVFANIENQPVKLEIKGTVD